MKIEQYTEKQVDIRDIIKRYNEWSEKQFPDSTAISSLNGLKRECDECINDIDTLEIYCKNYNECNTGEDFDYLFNNARIEYADCLIYLIDSARRFGLSIDSLFSAMDEKLQINKERNWKINDDKSYSHIKD